MAKIKAIKAEPSSAPTQGPGLIFREEVLNRRVKVLFDVDTGKEDEPMAHRWYEGTVSAVQLEPANSNAKAGGGGKRGGRRGANKKSAESTSINVGASTKLKATHRVTFDDGDERWFDLVHWVGKGELQWVGGEAPTPVSLPTMDPYADKTRNPTGTTTEAAEAAEAPNQKESARAAAAPSAEQSPLVSPPNGKRNASENSSSAEAPTQAKKAKADPPQQESPPHTLVNGTKYYVV